MTSIVDNVLQEPDFTDPAVYVPGVPHEALDAIRDREHLVWQPTSHGTFNGGLWLVTRYRDVMDIESRPADFSSVPGAFYPLGNLDGDSPMQKHILFMDPPEHSRLRRMASRSFGPRIVKRFDGWVREVTEEALDDAFARKKFDFVDDVAKLIPCRVMSAIMGVPNEMREQIVQWSLDVFAAQATAENDGGAAFASVFADIGQYMSTLGKEKLRNPQDDLLSVVAASLDNGEIDEFEYQMYATGILVAGTETTQTLMAQSIRLMVENEDTRATFEKAFTTGQYLKVVEECLRYVTPAYNVARTATRDLDFNGQQIRSGDTMQLILAAANRDPDIFTDPHRFDPFRDPKPLAAEGVAFGSGPHRCVGSMLAKLELKILFEEIHRRGARLDLNGQPERGWSALVNQLNTLPLKIATPD
ncbi:cytochrome P450 [Rhodococcus globerulus]|uniref:Cytochrome P450 n=1 Tax=Rhodococcus globerulus TaxID=33008 RepID=A0ABU4C4S5_RHOGO|nr:cytochrome P450 [Rhodococcus globerulus]MDV6271414.1 cytochrome P450 [Rhodococcus globerulus]